MNESQTEKESQHVLPFTDGLRVIDSGGRLGKVAIASSDFSPLDVVLLEPPAVVLDDKNGYFSLFDEFLASTSEVQQSILSMHHQDISTTETSTALNIHEDMEQRMRDMLAESELERYAMQKPSEASRLTDDLCKKLVRIVGINAHSFTPPNNAFKRDAIANGSTSSGRSMLDTAMALFVIGSKVEHSCAPNLRFCTDEGLLRYTAEVPISCEDRLSISYLRSTLHTPRDERQQFLLQNKKFDCRCTRCLGPDECSPLYCQKCKGALFNTFNVSKDEGEWCCSSTACTWETSGEGALNNIQTQLSALDEIDEDIQFFRSTLQYGIEESTLPAVMDSQAKVVEHAHPLHWLHIAAWDLVSIVASSNARILMKEGFLPTSSEVTRLLRLSATCQIHQIFWTERNAAIVHGRLKLKDAVDSIGSCAYSSHSLQVNFMEDAGEVSSLIDLLCDESGRQVGSKSEVLSSWNDCTEVSQTVFHAGQDILLAGYPKLASKLYTRYQSMFLVGSAPWVMSDYNKECFRVLVESGGNTNNFTNHLLDC